MKVFNQDKTTEISSYDLEKGYLKADKFVKVHHEAVPFVNGKTAKEVYTEMLEKGENVKEYYGEYYLVTETFDNGGETLEEIKPIADIPAQDAYDEYEDIQIYIPYTQEEIDNHKKNKLRSLRKPLLEAFDKWEKAVLRGREMDDELVMEWYYAILDLDEKEIENVPERVQYYL
jgi:hypothetical protein